MENAIDYGQSEPLPGLYPDGLAPEPEKRAARPAAIRETKPPRKTHDTDRITTFPITGKNSPPPTAPNMKLHLPKQLFTALLSAMVACVSLTCDAADIISINFTNGDIGKLPDDTTGITGTLEGVDASGWQNIEALNTAGTAITNQDGEAAGTITLSNIANSWQSDISTGSTLDSYVQKGYIDTPNSREQIYTVAVDHNYWLYDAVFYMSADSANQAYGSLNVNGVSYYGSDGGALEGTASWGSTGDPAGVTTYGADNSFKVTGLMADLTVQNEYPEGADKGKPRATLAGLQIIDKTEELVYFTTLGAGETTTTDATWVRGAETATEYASIGSDDKYLGITADAAGSTLKIETDDSIKFLGVKENVLTLTSDGSVKIEKLLADTNATINVNAALLNGQKLQVAGAGNIVFNTAQQLGAVVLNAGATTFNADVSLGSVSGTGALNFGDGVLVTLDSAIGTTGAVNFADGASIDYVGNLAEVVTSYAHDTYGYISGIDLISSATASKEVSVSINGEGDYTMNTDGTVTIGDIGSGNYYIAGDVSSSTILNSGDNLTTMSSLVVRSGTLTVDTAWSVPELQGIAGKITLTDNLTLSGDSTLTSTTIEGAGELIIGAGSTLTVNSTARNMKSNIRVGSGATLEFLGTGADAIEYDQTGRTIYVDGGKIDVGTTRQTVGNWTFDLTGATIQGAGQSTLSSIGLDFHKSSTINVNGAEGATAENPTISVIDTKVRIATGYTLTYDVDENARLNQSGVLQINGTIEKNGDGVLFLGATNAGSGAININAGTLATDKLTALGTGTTTVKNGAYLDLTAYDTNVIIRSDKDNSTDEFSAINDATNIVTEEGGYIRVAFNHSSSTELKLIEDLSLKKNIEAQGALVIHGSAASRSFTIGEGITLIAKGSSNSLEGLEAINTGIINISGGSVEASRIVLGHNDGSGQYWGKLAMSAGELTTGTIYLRQNHSNIIDITGGSLEFTSANALERQYPGKTINTATTITIGGSTAETPVTLKATQVAWTLDGAGLTTAPTIGNVVIDEANTHGITLQNVKLTGTITNNASLTISGTTPLAGAVTNNGSLTLSGTMDFSGATLSTESALITMGAGASLTINEGMIFKFGDLTADTEYKFIDESADCTLSGWDSITAEQIYINGVQLNSSGYSITTVGGVFSFTQLISSLTWTGPADGGIWDSTSQNWTTGSATSAYIDTIDTKFTSEADVTVAGAITTGNLTIGEENAQTGITVSLTAGEGASLTVASGKTLTINANSTLESSLGIDVSGATVSMGTGAAWNLTSGVNQNLTKDQLVAVENMKIAEGATLTVNGFSQGDGKAFYNASALSGSGELVLVLNDNNNAGTDASGNGSAFNLENFTGKITVSNAGYAGRLLVSSSTLNAASTIALANNGAELVFASGTEDSPSTLTNNVTVLNSGSASAVDVGSSVHVNSGKYAEISGNISGFGQLFKKGSGQLTLSGAVTVPNLKVMGGTLVLSGTGNKADTLTYLGVGGGGTLNVEGAVTTGQLRMSEQGTSAVNIKSGGSLTISGTDNTVATSRSLLLQHWGHNSTLTLEGGELISSGAQMFMSWAAGGIGTFTAKSGTATLLGINFLAQSSAKRGNFNLGSETEGSARVNIGSAGISNVDSANVAIKLGEGTLGALSDWEMAANTSNTGNVQLIGTNSGTVFNTEDATTPGTEYTITINAALSGSGKLVKDGAGTLKLSGANTYTGTTTVKNGILEVAASGGIGSSSAVEVQKDATLKISATGNDSLLTTATGAGTVEVAANQTLSVSSAISNIKVSNGALLVMGNGGSNALDISSLESVILNGGSVKWNAVGTTLKKLDVQADSDWTVFDMGVNNETWNSTKLVINTVSVAGGATLTVNKATSDNASWKQDLNIGVLTGSNTSEVIINGPGNSHDGEQYTSSLEIDSLENFAGALSISSREFVNANGAKKNAYEAVINTGDAGATLKELSLSGFGQAEETSRATINVQGDTSVANLNVTDSASFVISEGKKLSIANGSVNNGTMNAGKASIASASAETPATMSNVAIQNSGISATATDGSKGAISNALVEMQSATSFSISDMVLSNVKLSAVAGASVALNNVSAANTLLTGGGNFTLNATPTVEAAANDTTTGRISYTCGLGVESGSSLTLNLDVINAVSPDQHGTYDLTITLSGFGESFAITSEEAIRGMVKFDASSWLAQALDEQGAEWSAEITASTENTVAAQSSVPKVTYSAGTGENVGTLVITISGLNVPEPTTSTLSLLALTALCARRRRK